MHKQFQIIAAAFILASPTVPAQSVLLAGNSLDSPEFNSALDSLGLTHTAVSPFNYGTTGLNGFHMVWLDGFSQYSPGTPGNPGLSASALTSFMQGGGVVLVQNPGFGSEALAAYPFGDELAATFTFPPGEDTIRITDPANAVNTGLSGSSLSGWTPSAYGIFTGSLGSFSGISDNGSSGNWITLVRPVGAGELIYTQQGISERLAANPADAAALAMVRNIASIPEPSPLTLWTFLVPVFYCHRLLRGVSHPNPRNRAPLPRS